MLKLKLCQILNAELGFSEPLEPVADDDSGDAPELTVVGGTEHTPDEVDSLSSDGESETSGGDVYAEAETVPDTVAPDTLAPDTTANELPEPEVEVEDLQALASDILVDSEAAQSGESIEGAQDGESASGVETEPRS